MKTEKENKQMPKKPRKTKKIIKWVIILIILGAICFAAAKYLPRLLAKEEVQTKVITYSVEEITFGSVSTTISGSGNLSPVSKQTFTAEYAGEITKVNFKVGDEVKEDDVIAKVTYTIVDFKGKESTEDAEITAPYEGILTEVNVKKGDELFQGGQICSMMGKDGFSLS